jgi:MarR family transcriptional regulator, organic hydroperoxide resistance regulator
VLGYVTRELNPLDERALACRAHARGSGPATSRAEVPEQIVARLGMDVAELRKMQRRLTRVIEAATKDPA